MSDLLLRGVTHRYPRAGADTLRAVDLDVADGRLVSVVGPSGSGKTTLLRTAAGLERPSAGEVLVDGAPVTGLPPERRDLTVLFQQPYLFPHLDVLGNVAFAPRLAGMGRRAARRCAERYLDLVHLGQMHHRGVAALSGGQQQRVALARALAAERGALLLDEPFGSLDQELRRAMHDLLGEIRAALSPTILMITHDLDEAGLADETVVLIDGTVHQAAPTPVLHRAPATLATARLVGGFSEVTGRVTSGTHHSAWGAVELPRDCPAEGEAMLLLRRENLTLDAPEEPAAHRPGFAVTGRVTRTRPSGARFVVTVDPAAAGSSSPAAGRGGHTGVDVELPPGVDPPHGDVVVTLRPGLRAWAVPQQAPDAADPASSTDLSARTGPAAAPARHSAGPPARSS